MAYGLKYQGRFKSVVKKAEYEISIYKDGFAASSTELTFGNVQLTRGESDMLDQIKGSELVVDVINTTDFQFEDDFGAASYGDFYITVYEDPDGSNDFIWQGYNIPNTYSEPYNQTPYPTRLSFNCGLGHLQYKFFEDAGTVYSGQKTLIEIIRLCLNRLPNAANISQSIRESINIYENTLYSGAPTTAESMLNAIYTDVGMYKEEVEGGAGVDFQGWTCYKVLEEVLKVFNGRIYSYGGLWYIDQIREQRTTPIYYRDFLPRVGSENTVTVDGSGNYGQYASINRTTLNPTPSGELSILESLEKIKYTYQTQNVDYPSNDLFINGYLQQLTAPVGANDNGIPFNWTPTGHDPTTYEAMKNIPANYSWGYRFDPSVVENASAHDGAVYLEQTKTGVNYSTSDSIILRFLVHAELEFTTGSNNLISQDMYNFMRSMYVYYDWEITVGAYYLSFDGSNYSWTTTASRISGKQNIFWGQAPFFSNDSGTNEASYNYYLQLPTLPFSGTSTFGFKMFQPFHDANGWTAQSGYDLTCKSIYLGGFQSVYLPSQQPATETVILQHEIDEEAEEVQVEVIHGDGPNSISQGSFRLASGAITENWSRRGVSENKGISEIWIEDVSELRDGYARQLSFPLVGDLKPYNVVAHTLDAVTTYYLINGFDWSLTEDTIDTNLIEIRTGSRASFTTLTNDVKTLSPSQPANLERTIAPTTVVNERVSLSETSTIEAINQTYYNYYKRTGYTGFYTFNENSTTDIKDYSQNGLDGTGSNLTVSATTRNVGFDAVFNGTTSELDFATTSEYDSINDLGIHLTINLTSNTGTDTVFNIPGVFKINFDGTNLIAIMTTAAGDYPITLDISGVSATGTWYDCAFYWTSNLATFEVTDGGLTNETGSIATSSATDTVGSISTYLGYDGTAAHANFLCNELQIADSTLSTKNVTGFLNEENGILITDFGNSFELGDIVATDWENDLKSGIVTYVGTNEIRILPVDGQVTSTGWSLERAGHLWDSTRQWQFIINNDPSICFYDGISLTTEIAAASKKLYCLDKDGIIETTVTKTANYTLTNNDSTVYVDTSGGAFTLTLPPTEAATPTGKEFNIIDKGGACGSNNLTVDGGDYNINGEATGLFTSDYESWTLKFNGTEYNLK